MRSNISDKKLTIILLILILIAPSMAITGCLEGEKEEEEPEDVFMDVKETDYTNEGAREGNEFIWLKVEMTNGRDEEIELDRSWFELEIEEGLTYGDPEQEGMVTQLGPEEITEFWLRFEISEEDEPQTLWFRPIYEDEPVSWTDI